MASKWQQWMPLKIDAFRASPAVQAMHPAARAGYIYLLLSAWQTDDCTVSADPLDLAETSGLGDELWALYGARIIRKFDEVEGGKLRNAVLFVEWQEAREIFEKNHLTPEELHEKRSSAGRKGNEVRWRKIAKSSQMRGNESQNDCKTSPTVTGTETVTSTEEQEQKPLSIPSTAPAVKSADAVAIWNSITQGKLPQAKSTPKRQTVIQTRLKEPGWLPDFRAACSFLAETPWYTGANDRGWVATIDFALQAGKATELAEKATQPHQQGATSGNGKQHHRSGTDQRYIEQLLARDARAAAAASGTGGEAGVLPIDLLKVG
jgi:hypothetical protein